MPRTSLQTDLGETICIVEGSDDAHVFEAIRLAASVPEVSIVEAGGLDKIGDVIALLSEAGRITQPGTCVGLAIDADEHPSTALARLEGWRRDHQKDGTRWELLVLPSEGPGELETLVERSFSSDLAGCIDAFVACVEPFLGERWRKPRKVRTGVARAVLGRSPASLGVLVQQGSVDVSHEAFDEIRLFLNRLASA